MESKKLIKCSLCGEIDHNKRTCPLKPIEDTTIRGYNRPKGENYIEEEIEISSKKEYLILDLLDKESYDINTDLFKHWLQFRRPIQLKELRYVMDKGLSKDSIKLYIELANDIDSYY